MIPDPLVEAIARTILRHQLSCNQPAEPPAWITAAAQDIADAMRNVGWNPYPDDVEPDLLVAIRDPAPELNRRRHRKDLK